MTDPKKSIHCSLGQITNEQYLHNLEGTVSANASDNFLNQTESLKKFNKIVKF